MTTGLDLAGIYERAAEGYERGEYGWCQNDFFLDADGKWTPDPKKAASACIMGACHIAAGTSPEDGFNLYRYEMKRCVKFGRYVDPANWNNVKGRTKAEVIAKLREAASAAREAGGEE
jgi:hypothetical protein